VQEAQARELVEVLPTAGDLLVMGDLNSAADGSGTASYATVVSAGLTDPWALLHPGDPGLTCCFAPDLRDPAVGLTERIDFVLYRGALSPAAVTVVGASPSSKTAAGLYPSDHAGVVATFRAGG
jgi:endonuclease/exonuclease/phosphatase family metal-dependent hydrolase